MMDEIIRFDCSVWGNPSIDSDVKALSDKYGILFPDDELLDFTDQINLLIDGDEDKRAYRKALQIFDLCEVPEEMNAKIKIGKKTLNIDGVLFKAFHGLRDEIMCEMFGNTPVEIVHDDLKKMAKKEQRDEVLLGKKITNTLVCWLRSRGIFKTPSVKTSLGNKEGAFIYDVLSLIGYPPEKQFDWMKVTNKTKTDAIKNRLK